MNITKRHLYDILKLVGAREFIEEHESDNPESSNEILTLDVVKDDYDCESFVLDSAQSLFMNEHDEYFLSLYSNDYAYEGTYFSQMQHKVNPNISESDYDLGIFRFVLATEIELDGKPVIVVLQHQYEDDSKFYDDSLDLYFYVDPSHACKQKILMDVAEIVMDMAINYSSSTNINGVTTAINQMRKNGLDEGYVLNKVLNSNSLRVYNEFQLLTSILLRHANRVGNYPAPEIRIGNAEKIIYSLPPDKRDGYLVVTDIDGNNRTYQAWGELNADTHSAIGSMPYIDTYKLEAISAHLESKIRDGIIPFQGEVPESLYKDAPAPTGHPKP